MSAPHLLYVTIVSLFLFLSLYCPKVVDFLSNFVLPRWTDSSIIAFATLSRFFIVLMCNFFARFLQVLQVIFRRAFPILLFYSTILILLSHLPIVMLARHYRCPQKSCNRLIIYRYSDDASSWDRRPRSSKLHFRIHNAAANCVSMTHQKS
jgi:FlaA1/EpsC-like NDP-sugar epimerase